MSSEDSIEEGEQGRFSGLRLAKSKTKTKLTDTDSVTCVYTLHCRAPADQCSYSHRKQEKDNSKEKIKRNGEKKRRAAQWGRRSSQLTSQCLGLLEGNYGTRQALCYSVKAEALE